jgi:hypothetical protein
MVAFSFLYVFYRGIYLHALMFLLKLMLLFALLFDCSIDNCSSLLKLLDAHEQVFVLKVSACLIILKLVIKRLTGIDILRVLLSPIRMQSRVSQSRIIELIGVLVSRARCKLPIVGVNQIVEHVDTDKVGHVGIHLLTIEQLKC